MMIKYSDNNDNDDNMPRFLIVISTVTFIPRNVFVLLLRAFFNWRKQ